MYCYEDHTSLAGQRHRLRSVTQPCSVHNFLSSESIFNLPYVVIVCHAGGVCRSQAGWNVCRFWRQAKDHTFVKKYLLDGLPPLPQRVAELRNGRGGKNAGDGDFKMAVSQAAYMSDVAQWDFNCVLQPAAGKDEGAQGDGGIKGQNKGNQPGERHQLLHQLQNVVWCQNVGDYWLVYSGGVDISVCGGAPAPVDEATYLQLHAGYRPEFRVG